MRTPAVLERLRPATEPLELAVVGAGISGLACARTLVGHGHRVRVFDKARGVGGRMATRRSDGWQFDHGAQYFTARDPRFGRWVEAWREDALVLPWDGEIATLERGRIERPPSTTERLVPVPGMSSLCRHLAADVDVTLETLVTGLERVDGRWRLIADEGVELGPFDAVVVSIPAPQAALLLERAAPAIAKRAASASMSPCWAVMVSFDGPLDLGFDAAFVRGAPVSWIARNASKPARGDGEAWVIHGSPDWSREHLELGSEDAAERLVSAFAGTVGGLDRALIHRQAHRWRFALAKTPLPEPCLVDAGLRLAACGDWCGGARVEAAFLSGCAAAGGVLALRPE